MNKKYLPSALILYLNYFIHGIGCSILGQQSVKELLAGQWGNGAERREKLTAAGYDYDAVQRIVNRLV